MYTCCLPEEIFEIRQLVVGQMDDDGVFVLLSMKEMRNPGQQYRSVCSERAWASVQGNISLQFLFQQPGDHMPKLDQRQ